MPRDIKAEVLNYLLGDEARSSFSEGELDGALGAISNNRLPMVIDGFLGQLGPKSQVALDIKQFTKSVVRSLISVTKSKTENGFSYSFDDAKEADAIENFRRLDKSKYDKDTIDIAQDIIDVLNKEKLVLKYHDKFNPAQYSTVFATQSVPESLSNDENKSKVAHLIAGITAKLAGIKSPLVSDHKNLKTALVAAHDGVIDALKDNQSLLSRGAQELMMIGKAVGKMARTADKSQMKGVVTKSLNDHAGRG